MSQEYFQRNLIRFNRLKSGSLFSIIFNMNTCKLTKQEYYQNKIIKKVLSFYDTRNTDKLGYTNNFCLKNKWNQF